MFTITVQTPGFKAFQDALQRVSRFRRSVVLDQLADLMLEQNRARLDQAKEGPDGDSWEPWTAAYSAKNSSGELLEKSGDLLDSLQASVGRDSVSLGSDLLYAAVHQYGDDKRGIPARPYMGFSDDDLDELGALAETFLRGLFR